MLLKEVGQGLDREVARVGTTSEEFVDKEGVAIMLQDKLLLVDLDDAVVVDRVVEELHQEWHVHNELLPKAVHSVVETTWALLGNVELCKLPLIVVEVLAS